MKTRLYPFLLLAALLMPQLASTQTPDTSVIVIGNVSSLVQGGGLPYRPTIACYTQQLVLESELNGAAMITGIDLFCGMESSSVGRPGCTIYLANTYVPLLNDMVPLGIQSQRVAVNSFVCTRGWNHYDFDTAFYYNGLGNLVVAFDCPGGTGGGEFFCELTQNISRYYSDRLGNYTPTSSTNGINYRNAMRLYTIAVPPPANNCPVPTLWVDSIGTTAVKMKWSPGYQDTSWTLECIADSDTAWRTSGLIVWGDTSYTMTGLTPNTHYTFRLTAFCSDTSSSVLKHVLTNCLPTALPYSEDFEGTSSIPNCWYTMAGSTSSYPSIITQYSHSSSHSIRLYGGSLVLPFFEVSPDSLELSFWAKKGYSSNSHNLYVGMVTDIYDPSSFVPIDTIDLSQQPEWNPVVVRFDHYNGTSGRIAIKSATADMTYLYIDDIRVNRIVSCHTIQTVNIDQITDTSAVVHWVDSSVYYEVAYGFSGFTIDSTHIITSIWTDSLPLTGLQPYTLYDVYVRSYCGSFNTNWSLVRSFRTQCSKLTLPHYSVNFDNYADFLHPNEFPCWRGQVENNTCVTHISEGSHSGVKLLRWGWSIYNRVTNQKAILPAINTTVLPINTLKLSFWARNEEDRYNLNDKARIVVGVMSDPDVDSTFQPIDTVNITSEDWCRYDVPLDTYNGTGMYITMKSCPGIGTRGQWVAHIDDLLLNSIPPCPSVTGMVLTGLTATSVTVEWNSRDSGIVWQTIIDTSNLSPYSYPFPTLTSHLPSYTFTGLTAGTTYNVWVRAICPRGDTSYWEGPLQVKPGLWNMRANRKDTLTMCGVSLYDDGGDHGNFSSDQRTSLVIRPDSPGHLVSVSGRCNISGLASLTIYDGINTSGSVLWATGMNNNVVFNLGPIISDSGPLTFAFSTSTSSEGFLLFVRCIPDTCIIHHLQLDTSVVATDSTLALTWECNGALLYEVEYGPVGFAPGTGTLDTTSTNSFTITGLTSLNRREVHVRSICGVGDTGNWVRGIFTTQPCSDAIFRVNFDSTMRSVSSAYDPIGTSNYSYSYLQTLIDSAHLAGLEGGITALAFHPNDYLAGDHLKNITVYLSNVSDTSLNNGVIIPDAEHRFVKVIDSANFCHLATTEWQHISFDRPFMWDGHRNLLVAVLREDGSSGANASYSAHYRRTDSDNNIRRSYRYSRNYPISIDDVPNFSHGGSWYIGDIRLYTNTCDMPLCAVPVVDTVTGNYESISLSWQGTGNDYQLTISPDMTGVGMVSVSANSYTFTDLQPATTYQVALRQNCTIDSLGLSDWDTIEFTTGINCPAPDSLRVFDITSNTATFDWTPNEGDTLWQLEVWKLGERHVCHSPTSHPYTVENLTPGTEYCAHIHGYCVYGSLMAGDWSDTVCFSTLHTANIGETGTDRTAFSATLVPNPAKEFTTLLLESVPQYSSGSVEITISDLTGREISKQTINCNGQCSPTLDISNLPQGAYFVRVTCGQDSVIRRLVVR